MVDRISLFQRAIACFQRGQIREAHALARELLSASPHRAEHQHLFGLIVGRMGKHEEASGHIAQAIRLDASNPTYHLNHALSLQNCGRTTDALNACDEAIRLDPSLATAHFRRGNLLREIGLQDKAAQAYRRSIRLRPDYAEAYYNLGNILRQSGESSQSVSCYLKAISINCDFPDAYNNLGIALLDLERPTDALSAFQHAIRIRPDYAEAHNNLGMALTQLDRRSEALEAFGRAIELDRAFAEAYNNRGLVLKAMGQLEAACEDHHTAIELNPAYAQAHDNLLLALNYLPELPPGEIFQAHIAWNQHHAHGLARTKAAVRISATPSGRRLRVGYVSPDFRTHSVAFFFEPLLRAHDRDTVEIFCYSDVQNPDAITESISTQTEHWETIARQSDEAVAEKIQQDEIDILVDLAGHMAHNRLLVFARKPAPIQVTWLGYPNTSGLHAMDYRITDAVADPVGEADSLHSEKLVRLPKGFLCYKAFEHAPPVAEPPAIANGHITFGSFNNLAKINCMTIRLWADILHSVPNSRLILKDKALSDAVTRNLYLGRFEKLGIKNDRIELIGRQVRITDHLAFYGRVDIGLDPSPYNGTTTSCEALWMGVPVITLRGDRHAGRVGASILTQAGYPCWIADDASSYVSIAQRLASNIKELIALRSGLRENISKSSLCDCRSFAVDMEEAYQKMWSDYSDMHL